MSIPTKVFISGCCARIAEECPPACSAYGLQVVHHAEQPYGSLQELCSRQFRSVLTSTQRTVDQSRQVNFAKELKNLVE